MGLKEKENVLLKVNVKEQEEKMRLKDLEFKNTEKEYKIRIDQ